MIDGLIYTLLTVGLILLLLGLLWNIKIWGITYTVLSMAFFIIAGFGAIETNANGIIFFDYNLVWLCIGLIIISCVIAVFKILQELNIEENTGEI